MSIQQPAAGVAQASEFLRGAIDEKLAELREACAVKRQIKRNAFGRRWALNARGTAENERNSGSSDKYWDDCQAVAQTNAVADLAAADKALADFIAEHRPLMGVDWIGNEHGRLCWEPFLGGLPIDQHYCQREEAHDGNHAVEWPETRWACDHRRGSWPQGVTNVYEWRELVEKTKAAETTKANGGSSC